MPWGIRFHYDAGRNILFTEDDYEVLTEVDLEEFFSLLEREFEKVRQQAGGKFYTVSRIDGLIVGSHVVKHYGKRVKNLFERHVMGHARYAENPRARLTVRTASLKGNILPNIYSSREEAIRAIEEMKDKVGKQTC